MNVPKLSIALTTYNHEKYITDALDSIINQKLNWDYEIVIGNDCSTDNTQSIILDYKQRFGDIIQILPRSKNLGYVKNFSDTLLKCRGEYIAIFDGDDIMLPDKLNKQIDFLNSHPEYILVGHDVRVFDSKNNNTLTYYGPKIKKDFYLVEDLIKHGSFIPNPSKMFRRSAMPKEGIDTNIIAIADWYITIEICFGGKIGYINEVLADYRVHGTSIMQNIKGNTHFHDISYILNKLESRFPKKYTHLFNHQFAYAYLIKGIFEFQSDEVKESRKSFITSIMKSPFYSISPYIRLLFTTLPNKYLSGVLSTLWNKKQQQKV